MVISKKTILSQGLRGVQHFPGGSNFSRGVKMLISIETHTKNVLKLVRKKNQKS